MKLDSGKSTPVSIFYDKNKINNNNINNNKDNNDNNNIQWNNNVGEDHDAVGFQDTDRSGSGG